MLTRSFWARGLAILLLASCHDPRAQTEASPEAVLDTYVDIAQAAYDDSLATARELEQTVEALLDNPGEDTLRHAREAWIEARVPYMQTEVYRFGNPVVDEWEARVNAWPLDEGLIDYTAEAYGEESLNNYFYTANVIANPRLEIGGFEVDAEAITPELLRDLHMIDGVEANVATGYHAIEFLLWGQDLHGTEPGNGDRPWTDYSLENCTHGNCDRRRDYLRAAMGLLVEDLAEMAESWRPDGAAYQDLMAKGVEGGLATMLTGMGSLAYGELAGERTRLAMLLNDPEEEHDCFSDNTHNAHYYGAQGIANVYYGEYQRVDGSRVSGPSLHDLAMQEDPQIAAAMEESLAQVEAAMGELVEQARQGNTFDTLIAPANEQGEAVLNDVVQALTNLTRRIETLITTLELDSISIEGSESLDDPALVL